MKSTASSQEEKKGRKKSLAIGALFLAIFSAVGGAFLDRFSQAVVDKFFPPGDQISGLIESVDSLTQDLSSNSDLVTSLLSQLTQAVSDPDAQSLVADLTTQVNSLQPFRRLLSTGLISSPSWETEWGVPINSRKGCNINKSAD